MGEDRTFMGRCPPKENRRMHGRAVGATGSGGRRRRWSSWPRTLEKGLKCWRRFYVKLEVCFAFNLCPQGTMIVVLKKKVQVNQ